MALWFKGEDRISQFMYAMMAYSFSKSKELCLRILYFQQERYKEFEHGCTRLHKDSEHQTYVRYHMAEC